MNISHPNGDTPSIESLAERFVEQLHGGDAPTIDGYVQAYPALADEIRDLFPTILRVETLRRCKTSGRPIPGYHAERMPEKLSDYRIVREIGRGGMGIVYEAEQLSLKRRVAIKVLPRGCFMDPVRRDRFQREAEIAGGLHHTNIVPIHGIGNDEGYDFFVMQYIDGVSLDQLVAAANTAEDRIDWRRVARIGIQAARAIHYAHEQGVLHRDIKPANLLLASDELGEQERVWVTDFGLALVLECDSQQAQAVGTPGTLRYMPLEQLEGQPTARSDIYSLGLTLYELLAGCPAYDDSSSSRLLQRIGQGDVTPLRAIDPEVPRDLEAILRKATDKDELQRYRTARDLADDLERLLANRPVRARRMTPVGRAVRWTQRNPLAAVLSCIAATLLIGVITATTIGYLSAKAGERREAALRQSEQEQRMREADQRRRAEAALRLAMESLDELFAQIESNRRPGQRLSPEEARGMLDALGRMLAFYEQLAEQGQGGLESQIRVAEALRRMGDLHRSLNEYDNAESTLLDAIALLDRLIEDSPDQTEPRIQHARANYTLGRVFRDIDRFDEGDALIQSAIAELESLPEGSPPRRHIQELLNRFRRDIPRAAGE